MQWVNQRVVLQGFSVAVNIVKKLVGLAQLLVDLENKFCSVLEEDAQNSSTELFWKLVKCLTEEVQFKDARREVLAQYFEKRLRVEVHYQFAVLLR